MKERHTREAPLKIFTNGCFDLLHPGHISLLKYCSTLGRVIVGLNSDSSVNRLKGSSRPIMSQIEREYALQACKYVDEVHIFEQDTPLELIEKLRPDFIVKGAEFRKEDVIGLGIAEVLLFKGPFDISTTQIIHRIERGGALAD